MNRPLSKAEERAEAALWRAREWLGHVGGFRLPEPERTPSCDVAWGSRPIVGIYPASPSLLHHLIDIGRVYP